MVRFTTVERWNKVQSRKWSGERNRGEPLVFGTRYTDIEWLYFDAVLEERVMTRIRMREESGPTGFPLIVPDAADDTVCRNAHGVVCPFERLCGPRAP